MDFGKDLTVSHRMHANFIKSFGDPESGLSSPALDFNSDIFPYLHEFFPLLTVFGIRSVVGAPSAVGFARVVCPTGCNG